jgi:hypothetical protein
MTRFNQRMTQRDIVMAIEQQVLIGPHALSGELHVPAGAGALVLFAHGSGSNRRSPRNRFVAKMLHERHLGTLLFDLLTEREAHDAANVFNIGLLARLRRVAGAAGDWFDRHLSGAAA